MILYRTKQNIKLTILDVMLGIISVKDMDKNDLRWVNQIILVGKMVISKFKYGPHKFPIELLKSELELRKLKDRIG